LEANGTLEGAGALAALLVTGVVLVLGADVVLVVG
jgi:hypothetical protein